MSNLDDSSLEQAGESAKLLNLLNTLEAELEIPYIERRRLTKAQKANSLLELQDAINEISQRERDLQASIGISKVLIENNDNLLSKNRDLSFDNTRLQSQIDQLNEDLLRVKNQSIILQEKYQTTSAALAHTETKLLKLKSQISSPDSAPIKKKSQEEKTVSLERYDNDLSEMAERFKKEYDFIHHAKSEIEKKCKGLEQAIDRAKETQAAADDQYEDLMEKHRRLEESSKKFEKQIEKLIEEREEIEQKFDDMYKKHQALLDLVERQAEDLEILEGSRLSRSQPLIQESEPESLKNELDILEEKIIENSLDFAYLQSPDFDPIKRFGSSINLRNSIRGSMRPVDKIYLEPPEPKPLAPDLMKRLGSVANVRASFRSLPRTISAFRQQPISIEARRIRKDPSEEYFTLVTQAIKMNSPYMDVICVVSPKTLYQTAQKNDIPFHKWHIWVEKQLNAAYLQTIYKKESTKSKF